MPDVEVHQTNTPPPERPPAQERRDNSTWPIVVAVLIVVVVLIALLMTRTTGVRPAEKTDIEINVPQPNAPEIEVPDRIEVDVPREVDVEVNPRPRTAGAVDAAAGVSTTASRTHKGRSGVQSLQQSPISTSPSGKVRTIEGQANKIGYFYDPSTEFRVAEVGVWRADLRVCHDGLTSAGQVQPPYPEGDVLGSREGEFWFYVVEPSSESWKWRWLRPLL